MRRSFAATLTLVLALFPSALAAQTSLTVSGFAGVFIPATDLFDELQTGGALRFGHESGAAFGGRVAVWPSRKLGVEAEAGYLASDVGIRGILTGPGGGTVDETIAANAFVASINVLYAIIRPPLEPLAIFISGGVGVVSRGGDFFDTGLPGVEFDKTTSVAGVVGLGISYGLSQMLSIRADVKDYISSFDEDNLIGDAQLQNDILITGSLELTFGGG